MATAVSQDIGLAYEVDRNRSTYGSTSVGVGALLLALSFSTSYQESSVIGWFGSLNAAYLAGCLVLGGSLLIGLGILLVAGALKPSTEGWGDRSALAVIALGACVNAALGAVQIAEVYLSPRYTSEDYFALANARFGVLALSAWLFVVGSMLSAVRLRGRGFGINMRLKPWTLAAIGFSCIAAGRTTWLVIALFVHATSISVLYGVIGLEAVGWLVVASSVVAFGVAVSASGASRASFALATAAAVTYAASEVVWLIWSQIGGFDLARWLNVPVFLSWLLLALSMGSAVVALRPTRIRKHSVCMSSTPR